MISAARLPDELLSQAHHLARKELGRPRQASLRRAVSTAYYALFHLLVGESTRSLAGTERRSSQLRALLGRAYRHDEMAKASKGFSQGASGLPPTVRALPEAARIPDDLADVAQAFCELRYRRESADHDVAAWLNRREVSSLVRRAETAMQCWKRVRQDPASRLYLISLLAWSRMPKE